MKKAIFILSTLLFLGFTVGIAAPAKKPEAKKPTPAAETTPAAPSPLAPDVSDTYTPPPVPVTDACKAELAKAEPLLDKEDETLYDAAAQSFKKAIEAQYDCVPALIGYTEAVSLGRGFKITQEDYIPAYEYIARALVLEPKNARGYWVMADLMRHVNRTPVAVWLADKSISLDPKDPWGHYVLGSSIMSLNPELAATEFLKALELKPGWRRVYLNLAATYINGGKFKEAETQLNIQLKNDPTNIKALTNMGIVHLRLGKLPLAESDFRNAMKYDPNFPMALKGLGDVGLAKKDYRLAIEQYSRYLDAQTRDDMVWALLGQAQEGAKDLAAARKSYETAISLNDGNAEARKRLDALNLSPQ